ncbi:MAG: response regulator [Melioribacteraceae bacterium]
MVLIIDDEIDICKSIQRFLELKGIDAVYSQNPNDAESLIDKHKIKLLILDIKMPEINGIELIIKIKTTTPDLEIVVLSAFPSENNIANSYKKGASSFLSKPIDDWDAFLNTILFYLNKTVIDKILLALKSRDSITLAELEILTNIDYNLIRHLIDINNYQNIEKISYIDIHKKSIVQLKIEIK